MAASCLEYEPQLARPGLRTCGAAALCMVYRSLGMECQQEEVWDRLAARRRLRGGVRTCALAADAIAQGLAAVVVQTRQPWPFLSASSGAGVRVILNHRLAEHSPWGHYTVLDRIDEEAAWLHDPQLGPSRRVTRDELLRLWEGRWGRTEIAGRVAVVVGRRQAPDTVWQRCQRGLLPSADCPNCQQSIVLEPYSAFWPERHWERIYCPRCDWSIQPDRRLISSAL